MIVYTDSWHYRWLASTWDKKPDNLCAYFWKCVGTAAAMFGLMSMMAIIAIAVSIVLTSPLWQVFRSPEGYVQFLAFIGWIAVYWSVQYHYRQWLWRTGRMSEWIRRHPERLSVRIEKWAYRRSEKKANRPKRPRQPSIVMAFLRAKKQRVCPFIDYRTR